MSEWIAILLTALYFAIGRIVLKMLNGESLIYVFTWPIIIFGFISIVSFSFLATVADVFRDKVGKPIVDRLTIWIKKR